jgi:hypothetical protein
MAHAEFTAQHEVLQEHPSTLEEEGHTEVLQGMTEVLPPGIPTRMLPTTRGFLGHTSLPQPDTHNMPPLAAIETPTASSTAEGHTKVLPQDSSQGAHDHKGITAVLPHMDQESPHDSGGLTEVLHDHVDFDPTRYYLGKLCPQGHAYQDTGKSLLRRSNQRCWECDKAMKRAIKARQKAARQEGSL